MNVHALANFAHELFHTIGGTDRPAKNGWITGPPSPLGGITVQQEELLEINIPQRKSVKP